MAGSLKYDLVIIEHSGPWWPVAVRMLPRRQKEGEHVLPRRG